MMLELLESGKALYALAAACVLGILSRLVARNLYKRLMKETDNMTLTKNRFLRDLKQKAENTYRLNQGIYNTKVYLERQLAGYRFIGLSLNGWGNLSGQLTVLCFLLGGAAAFGAYWYRCDSYFVALYGCVGVLAGLLTLFMDYGVNLGEHRNQLMNALQDYLENSLMHRLERETASSMEGNVREVSRENRGNRGGDMSRETDRGREMDRNRETDRGREMDRSREISEARGKESRIREKVGLVMRRRESEESEPQSWSEGGRIAGGKVQEGWPERSRDAGPQLSRKQNYRGYGSERGADGVEPIRDVDYLRRSLEQIAASREKNAEAGDWIKELSPKELELVGEILKQYLT